MEELLQIQLKPISSSFELRTGYEACPADLEALRKRPAAQKKWTTRVYPAPEPAAPRPVHLTFDRLQPFEVVQNQFQHLGVQFKNAIALIPSNPAYAHRRGTLVLMGAPRNGMLEILFDRPVHAVTGWVTSAQPVVMTAFDQEQGAIARIETHAANPADASAALFPNSPMSLIAANIHRIQFQAFNAHLVLSEFRFCV